MYRYQWAYEFFTSEGILYFDSIKEVADYICVTKATGKLIGSTAYYIFLDGKLIHAKSYYSEYAIIENKLAEFLSFDYAEITKTSDTEFIATLHTLDKTEVSFTYDGGEIQINSKNKEV